MDTLYDDIKVTHRPITLEHFKMNVFGENLLVKENQFWDLANLWKWYIKRRSTGLNLF